jgi:hypothetical protein
MANYLLYNQQIIVQLLMISGRRDTHVKESVTTTKIVNL